jgi:SAM-dependent methyltransferase
MRKRAVEKNPRATVVAGDHAELPFEDGVFDFIYLTDVIHHVPDLGVLFRNFRRVLKVAGRVCVVTESHAQIGARFYNRYFPSMEAREKERYPDLPAIVAAAQGAGLTLEGVETRATGGSAVVTEELVRTVEEKSFSMFRRLEEEEWRQGLERMRRDLGRSFENEGAGVSLVLLGA